MSKTTLQIPDDIMKTAEDTLDTLLCNCSEAGDVRKDSIMDIARALLAEREAQRERDAKIVLDWQSHIRRGELIEFHAMNVADAIRKSEA